MNYLLAVAAEGRPTLLTILFWLLLIFWVIGAFAWRTNPNWYIGNNVVIIILFAILGYYCLGNPF